MTSQLALLHRGCGVATVSICAIPVPANDEVVVKVAAVCLNPIDWKIFYGTKSSTPTILGCDFAGTVTFIGDDVTAMRVGDRVVGFVAGGKNMYPFLLLCVHMPISLAFMASKWCVDET
jgi:NADPH:quinone reductase-like Zn-dependent oxidoreductase